MIPRTFVPAMSASTEGPLAAPAPPRASRPPGAFRGALCSAAERPFSCAAGPEDPALARGASAATSAAAECSSARVSVVPQEGHAKPSAVSPSAAATAPAAFLSFFPALSVGAGSASTRGETQSPQKGRAQHDATVGSDGGSPQMEHTQRPCSAAARIIPRSAAGRRRAAATADAGVLTKTPPSFGSAPTLIAASLRLSAFAFKPRPSAPIRSNKVVVTAPSPLFAPPTSDGWLHAWRRRSSMCSRLT
mmetsp:Transcript_1766/g.7108  ORF Transcript_1766/g.7108 Transcript_1766/m.7108 type:complete len:248 (+) Transcript_1766:90-833(+)